MDYIREELLRQQALLVVLLTGQRLEPLEESGRQTTSPADEIWAEPGAQRLLQRNIRPQGTFLTSRDQTAEEAALWAALAAGADAGAWREPEAERPGGSTVRRRREANTAAGMPEPASPANTGRTAGTVPAQTARAAGMIPAQTGEVRLITELRRVERGEPSSPAALSLAFQRDARRYDGGFRLY